jgi:hypothetical protein
LLQVSLEDDGGRLRVEAFDARVGRRGHIRMRGQLPLQPPPRRCDPVLPALHATTRVLSCRTRLVLVKLLSTSSDSTSALISTLPCTCRLLQQQPVGSEPAAISVDLHNLELRARNLYTGTHG